MNSQVVSKEIAYLACGGRQSESLQNLKDITLSSNFSSRDFNFGPATSTQCSLTSSFSCKKKERRWGDRDVPGNKSDYRRVQINRKPSCQPPPTLGKARNNSACNDVTLKRFPAALLQLADRLYSAWLCCWWWITTCSQWHQFCVKRPKIQIWSENESEVSGFIARRAWSLRFLVIYEYVLSHCCN